MVSVNGSEINPFIYGQLLYDKKKSRIYNGKGVVSSTKGAGKSGQPHAKE